jgi:hypothetical protein
MISLLPAQQRGHTDAGWLDSWHTFSFGEFYNPRQMGFRTLRVINEDRVEAGQGFGTHPHQNMEIISVVLEGALQHRDSIGTGAVIQPNDVQRMTAGTGVRHSEFNGSKTEGVHFLQIWILPEKNGLAPGYEQKTFDPAGRAGKLQLVASQDGRDGSITVHQDVALYRTSLTAGQSVTLPIPADRHAWIQVISGDVKVSGTAATTGDGVAISDAASVQLEGTGPVDLLAFVLA